VLSVRVFVFFPHFKYGFPTYSIQEGVLVVQMIISWKRWSLFGFAFGDNPFIRTRNQLQLDVYTIT